MTVVVTADDLGLSPGVTRGIFEAHRRGVVRSTSLLVTFASSAEAAALARAEPDLEVGLHIDLVGGGPVSDPAAVPSLCDREGRFFRLAPHRGAGVAGAYVGLNVLGVLLAIGLGLFFSFRALAVGSSGTADLAVTAASLASGIAAFGVQAIFGTPGIEEDDAEG